MDKNTFRHYCAEQLQLVYQATKDGKPNIPLKHRTEGLLLAAELLDIINREAAMDLLEDEHMKVFGESISQRQQRKQALSELKSSSPDDYFEIPAIERRR
ncbi:MAG: hypothetical protein ACI88A_000432 [Paraglaciecola sp.]|jgi:hypothetical protein